MIVLITNDDGYDAPGLQAVTQIARSLFGDEVYVVAPDVERSGSGHSITLRRRLSLEARGPRAWAIGGTPADCVRVAVNALLPGPPDLVLAGANRGYNLGTDVYYSGTVSAAIEAAMGGFTAVAISEEDPGDRQTPIEPLLPWVPNLLQEVVRQGLPSRTLLNVNIPRRPARGLRITRLGIRQYNDRFETRRDDDGRPYFWLSGGPADYERQEGTDIAASMDGFVSVTPILLDLTHRDFIPILRSWNLAASPSDAVAVPKAP